MPSRRDFLRVAGTAAAGAALAPLAGSAFPDPEPTPAQRAWMGLGYGMFIHFGPRTLGGGWGDGAFPLSDVRFPDLSCEQWAEVAAEAGMRYAVLTVKHHDGFCLWPTEHTAFSVARTPVGDVVGQFVDAFRAAGIRPGFYYSLWDANYPAYADDDAYAAYVQAQIRELHHAYGPAVEWWFDGDWDKAGYPREQFPPYAERDPDADLGARWKWRELYGMIHGLSPESIVLLNPGATRPGEVVYTPVDARSALYFDFVHQDRIVPAPEGPVVRAPGGAEVFLPLEYATRLTPTGWFYTADKSFDHPSVDAIVGWHQRARAASANLLLDVGPDTRGLIPEYHRPFLRQAARRLDIAP